ncbi:MAG TPA: type I methionyl aminopeptidase [Planctomycetes bacterium]|nr:type I methionyl aminopeptidase [Planctomycetota bacterium]
MEIKSEAEIAGIREAGRVVAAALAAVGELVAPGVTTAALNRRAEEVIAERGAKPAFPSEAGFPAACCISVNEQVVHGLPDARKLKSGDIVSIDVGAKLGGFIGDAAWTFPVGEVSGAALRLLMAGRTALERAAAHARVGNGLDDIGRAIEGCARENGFTVVRDFVGHGVGKRLHEEPQVPNYSPVGKVLAEIRFAKGMVIAIEPMLNAGGDAVRIARDGWTVVTADGSISCHFEHTVAVGDDGGIVLTAL